MRKRYGVIQRSSVKRRTFSGIAYDSLLECCRARQLAVQEPTGLQWEAHPKFTLGCPENTYTADFRVWSADDPRLFVRVPASGWPASGRMIDVPEGWAEEVKGPVTEGVERLKTLWRAHGPVPLVILTRTGGNGLQTRWSRAVIIPRGAGEDFSDNQTGRR